MVERATGRTIPAPRNLFGAYGFSNPIYITMQLVDGESDIAAKFRYDEEVKDFLKQLPYPMKPRWNPDVKAWMFSPNQYRKAVREIKENAPKPVVVQEISEADLKEALRRDAVERKEVREMIRKTGNKAGLLPDSSSSS